LISCERRRAGRLPTEVRGPFHKSIILGDVTAFWSRLTTRAALAAELVVVSASIAAASSDRQVRTVALPADRTLLVDVTIGTIRIEGSDRSDAEIVIERDAPTVEALVPVAIDETPARVSIRAIQPGGGTNPALRTDVTLRVPRSAVIERAQVMEGRLTLSSFAGQIAADVRRGPIEGTDVSGILRLETGIGSVVLTGARLSPTGLLRLRAFNGDVRLTLAERPANARILALALNGHIKSEIPLTMHDTWGPRWGEATLGRGEPVISIDVVTGTVDLRSP
jgi:hypothetical protein